MLIFQGVPSKFHILDGRNPKANHRLDVQNPVNNGINYQPQLVHQQVGSLPYTFHSRAPLPTSVAHVLPPRIRHCHSNVVSHVPLGFGVFPMGKSSPSNPAWVCLVFVWFFVCLKKFHHNYRVKCGHVSNLFNTQNRSRNRRIRMEKHVEINPGRI